MSCKQARHRVIGQWPVQVFNDPLDDIGWRGNPTRNFHKVVWFAGGEPHLMAPEARCTLLLPIGAADLRGEAFLFASSYPLRCLAFVDVREPVVAGAHVLLDLSEFLKGTYYDMMVHVKELR